MSMVKGCRATHMPRMKIAPKRKMGVERAKLCAERFAGGATMEPHPHERAVAAEVIGKAKKKRKRRRKGK